MAVVVVAIKAFLQSHTLIHPRIQQPPYSRTQNKDIHALAHPEPSVYQSFKIADTMIRDLQTMETLQPQHLGIEEINSKLKITLINLQSENCESSSPGEFHPQALSERYVTVSRHTAPVSHMLETSRSQADIERNPVPPSFLVDHHSP